MQKLGVIYTYLTCKCLPFWCATRVISLCPYLRSARPLLHGHSLALTHSLHSRGQDAHWFVSWPVAQRHQRKKKDLQLHRIEGKDEQQDQLFLVPIASLPSPGISWLWRCAVDIPEAPFLAARHCVRPRCSVSDLFPPPHHPRTPSFACLCDRPPTSVVTR